jgi:hypothetical protein
MKSTSYGREVTELAGGSWRPPPAVILALHVTIPVLASTRVGSPQPGSGRRVADDFYSKNVYHRSELRGFLGLRTHPRVAAETFCVTCQ